MRPSEATRDRGRLLIPALGGLYETFGPLSYAFMRFTAGALLFPHGVQKALHPNIAGAAANIARHGMPLPIFLAYATIFAELVASACVALGLLTRIMAAIVFIEMAVIVFVYQWQFGYFWTQRGYEYALMWMLLMLAIMARGGGRYSIDHLIGKEF